MFVEVHTPYHLTGPELDAYLERGWFRMGQTIFTTNFAHVKDQMLSVIWLRVQLFGYEGDAVHTKLLQRNARFTTNIAPAELTEEKEILYARYRETLPFTISQSLEHLLFGKEVVESIYTTWEVTIRDKGRLIACGFFDLGGDSAEGIVSFYDPQYKKFSLGKYLIYCKIQFCKELGLQYFYPGYFVPGNPSFDYKLSMAKDALQFLQLSSNTWQDYTSFSPADIPAEVMCLRLKELNAMLLTTGLESHVLKYEFFDVGLVPDMRNSQLLDFPLFLLIGPLSDNPAGMIVVYDVRDEAYHLQLCMPALKPDQPSLDPTVYSIFFLKPVQEVYQSPDAQAITELLVRINKRTAIQK